MGKMKIILPVSPAIELLLLLYAFTLGPIDNGNDGW